MAAVAVSAVPILFCHLLRSCPHIKQTLCLVSKTHLYQIARLKSQWHLVSALCLERKPVISQELSSLEKEFQAYLDKVELEQSLLSDHELRLLKDSESTKKKSKNITEVDIEASLKSTAQDDEEAYTEELHQFKSAPRISEADKSSNVKSLQRHLDKHLVFLTKQKLGNDLNWGLPQTVRQEGETMKEAAERVCRQVCGTTLNAVFLGKAPVGYCKYKYPKAAREEGILGAKVFFFKAWHKTGDLCQDTLKSNSQIEDYMWATRSELNNKLSQKDYRKTIQLFLVDETNGEEELQSSANNDIIQSDGREDNRQARASN